MKYQSEKCFAVIAFSDANMVRYSLSHEDNLLFFSDVLDATKSLPR